MNTYLQADVIPGLPVDCKDAGGRATQEQLPDPEHKDVVMYLRGHC
ncbi:MAG: hypothetical protein HOP23_11205 [Methylococcaceae bacterium]|nr:hypothetical protein [Methylococcaceae bacterium]